LSVSSAIVSELFKAKAVVDDHADRRVGSAFDRLTNRAPIADRSAACLATAVAASASVKSAIKNKDSAPSTLRNTP
jgi:hypothetical protein